MVGTILSGLSRALADSLYNPRVGPKIYFTSPIHDCYSVVPPGAGAGYMERIMIPETGTITRMMCFITTSAGNVDLGIYDTSATTRNRLASTGNVACATVNTWHDQPLTSPLPVRGGDSVDLAISASSTAAFAAKASNRPEMGSLPAGRMPVPLGGAPKVQAYVASGFNVLPATIAEASMGTDGNFPLIAVVYS